MFGTGSEALPSTNTIAANNRGAFSSTHERSASRMHFALGSRLREMSRMSGLVEAIEDHVSVLPAHNSLAYRHLLVYRAKLRLMIFSRIVVSAIFPMLSSNGAYWPSGEVALQFSKGEYHG
jgi:hypothetical protein